jgi:cysteine desulfurase
MEPIYFDYNATTPLDPQVREVMLPFLGGIYGNPSSIHQVGRQARAKLDDARYRAATVLGAKPSEIVFTSGGTESVNLAILGAARHRKVKGRHIITSAIEHHAVLHCCEYLKKTEGFEVTQLPVTAAGEVTVESVEATLRPDTVLVSIMAANNEIGSLQPVAEIGALCRQRQVLFHTDAVQWFGKEPFSGVEQFHADLVSICAHKFYGPKGAGALYIRSPLLPDPILFGGGHENERRAGTENLAAIAGLVDAMERFLPKPVFDPAQLRPLTNKIVEVLKTIPGVELASPEKQRLPNTVAFLVHGTDSIMLLAGLDMEGICASSGSACSAGSLEPSHVIRALRVEEALARSLIRFSLGRESTIEEVDRVTAVLPAVIARAQRRQ